MASNDANDVALVSKAYEFAQTAHKDQKRYSGDPYFIHPAEVGYSLAEIGMDAKTIAAGLLHDVIEDAGVSTQTMEAEFGSEVLSLVQGVTKLGALRYRGLERHTESLRKLFAATAQDIRVLIIKLMDRLHNARTLEHVPREFLVDGIVLGHQDPQWVFRRRLGRRRRRRGCGGGARASDAAVGAMPAHDSRSRDDALQSPRLCSL